MYLSAQRCDSFYIMDTSSNPGKGSRFILNNCEISTLPSDNNFSGFLHGKPTPITSGLSRSSTLNNSCGFRHPKSVKRTSSDLNYDPNLSIRSNAMTNDCNSDVIGDIHSSVHQKNSPLLNGKKTKGRVKIKMEYIDNKLRRYTTFSKRKTGIMKKAYELSTLTGTQVMLLVASETGHVYTFATRKLQPMITSETGKALIQTCLNSPDPCPSGSGDQRMSATGFEETELSYNIGDDDRVVDASLCSPYRSDSSDSSDVDSVSGSPSSSPPPLISLQDLLSSSTTASTATSVAITAVAVTRSDSKSRSGQVTFVHGNHHSDTSLPRDKPASLVKREISESMRSNENCASENYSSTSAASGFGLSLAPNVTHSSINNATDKLCKNNNNTSGGVVFTLEQLKREFGVHVNTEPGMSHYITIPMLNGITNVNTANPPAAHQTPADLSNRSRK